MGCHVGKLWRTHGSGTHDESVIKPEILRSFATRARYSRRPLEEDLLVSAKVLGGGSSAKVYEASSRVSGQPFAVKTLSKCNQQSHAVESLEEEINNYMRLDHPHIARLVHVYEGAEKISLVMERCVGLDLFDHLQQRERFGEADARSVVRQLLVAVAYIHSQGVAHCDIKLENIILDGDTNTLKLLDFGFSKDFRDGKVLCACQGTSGYIAPEVYAGTFTEKRDLWSVGVVTFMLLSGSAPFSLTNDQKCRRQSEAGVYHYKAEIWNYVSAQARQLVDGLLVVSPEFRLCARDALKEAWFASAEQRKMSKTSSRKVLQDIQHYYESSSLTRAAFAMIGYHFCSPDLQSITDRFMQLHADCKGAITRESFAHAMEGTCQSDGGEVNKLFETVGIDGQGEIRYSEFVGALLRTRVGLCEDVLRETFERFDRRKKGRVTINDLADLFGKDNSIAADDSLDAHFRDCCVNCRSSRGMTYACFVKHLRHSNIGSTKSVGRVGRLERATTKVRGVWCR